jgi:hypothetical protein
MQGGARSVTQILKNEKTPLYFKRGRVVGVNLAVVDFLPVRVPKVMLFITRLLTKHGYKLPTSMYGRREFNLNSAIRVIHVFITTTYYFTWKAFSICFAAFSHCST